MTTAADLPTIAELRERDAVSPFRGQAEALGLVTFDTALPMHWYEDVFRVTGEWVQNFGVVWCYDKATIWGAPVPLTREAADIIARYDTAVRS